MLAPGTMAANRYLTYLFCDIVDSTRMTNSSDPEELYETIVRYQKLCTAQIVHHGGFVARFVGDGVVAYFGYPSTLEASAEAAVRCGLALRTEIEATDPGFAIRVGIASGWGVVGEFDTGAQAQELVAVSPFANLAARLEAAAPPNGILVSADTHDQVVGLFRFGEPLDLELKGFAELRRAYPVLGQGEFRTPSHARSHATPPELVGRDASLDRLVDAWQRRVLQGQGTTAVVSGPAGIGKSTLVNAFRRRLDADEMILCSSQFEQHTAFHPFSAWIGAFLDQRPDLDRARWLRSLLDPAIDVREVEGPLASLLGPPGQVVENAAALHERLIEVLSQCIVAASRRRPLLVVVEDAHWLDPSSAAVVERLRAESTTSGLLLLTTTRQRPTEELHASWTVVIELDELDVDDAHGVIDSIDAAGALNDEERAAIVEKAAGIPLLLTEFTRSTLASRSGDPSAVSSRPKVADSLMESFGARIEARSSDDELIATAAAIGEPFSARLLALATGRPEPDVATALEALVDAELLLGPRSGGDGSYQFTHALLCDAAYQRVVRSERRQLHGRILTAARSIDPDWDTTQPVQAAHHLWQTDQGATAVTVLTDAARGRFAASQFAEAAGLLNRGLQLVTDLPSDQAPFLELQLQTLLGLTLTQVAGFGEPAANQAYARAWEICGQIDVTGEPEFCAIWGIWAHKLVVSDTAHGVELARNLQLIAGELHRVDLEMLAAAARVVTSHCIGDIPSVRAGLDVVLASYHVAEHGALALSYSMDPKALSLLFAAHTFAIAGDSDAATAARRDAMQHAESLGFEFLVPYATVFGVASSLYTGADDDQLAVLDAAIALAHELHLPFWVLSGTMWKGVLHHHQGRHQDALAELRPALEMADAVGLRLTTAYVGGVCADSEAQLGDPGHLARFERSVAAARTTGEDFALPEILRLRAAAALRAGADTQQAAVWLDEGLTLARARGALAWEERILATMADHGLRSMTHP